MPREINKSEIYQKVKSFILENNLIVKGDRLLLSLSAGKDSVAMLYLLSELSFELHFEIGIFHLNHMTRGEESDGDEKFVFLLAENFDYKIYLESYDFISKTKGMSFEEKAREVRYDFLGRICNHNCYNKIATAHNNNDNGETMLMRIFTGTGIYGLMGIPSRNKNIVRPLLCLTSDEIYQFLNMNNIKWREDTSNSDNKFLRNFIRNNLIPEINKRFPAYLSNLSNLSAHAKEYYELFEEITDEQYSSAIIERDEYIYLDLEAVNNSYKLIKLMLSKILRDRYNVYLSSSVFNEIIKNLKRKKSNLNLYGNNIFILQKIHDGKNYLRIRPDAVPDPRAGEWEYEITLNDGNDKDIHINELGFYLNIKIVHSSFYNKNNENNKIFVSFGDFDTILIRNRRMGDKIKLDYGTKKIKDLLIEKKLDNEIKNCVPLLIIGREIAAFMPGFIINTDNRISLNFKITGETKKIVVITRINK